MITRLNTFWRKIIWLSSCVTWLSFSKQNVLGNSHVGQYRLSVARLKPEAEFVETPIINKSAMITYHNCPKCRSEAERHGSMLPSEGIEVTEPYINQVNGHLA